MSAPENMDKLVEAREQFDAVLALRPQLPERVARKLAALGRTLGVDEAALCTGLRLPNPVVPAPFEPPRVTLIGNMHDLLRNVCPPKGLLLVMAMGLAAVSCGAAQDPAVECAPRAGYYVFAFHERVGASCGARAPEVREEGQPTPIPAGCERDSVQYGADNCTELQAEVACGAAGRSTYVTWSADGATGAGEEDYATDGCASTYDVSVSRVQR